MLTFVLTAIMILVSLALIVISVCFYAAMTILPYISGAFISLVISTEVPFARALVPGHPVINYLAILFVVEIIIAALMHIKATGKATALSFSEIMVGIISMFALDAVKPDSIGYCVFVTVLYLILNLVFLVSNSSKYGINQDNTPAGTVISSLIYAFAAYFILAIPAELLWQRYIEANYSGALSVFTVIYWILRILVCGGIVLKEVMRARQQTPENIPLPFDAVGGNE